MLVTLLTSHAPMSWLKTNAPLNIRLYADTQHTEEKREGGRTLRQVTVHGSSEWVMCSWLQWHGGAIRVRCWGHVYNRFHEVAVVVAIIQVRIAMVRIRVPPGMWIRELG